MKHFYYPISIKNFILTLNVKREKCCHFTNHKQNAGKETKKN